MTWMNKYVDFNKKQDFRKMHKFNSRKMIRGFIRVGANTDMNDLLGGVSVPL